ncbi:hypothetical protein BDP27DRAFT_1530195 [Rhodocollybia butyracea]|uniref:Expansin-like EG45 domain-containing protein n=1 Tax=Rhodocollybia butyracea TaxID=206335 RepID=A0A9P5PU91_9AGAR|nr:hypothetical protein BDP27DRAFT_1530195 [Rhodocollybia butyracea]
MPRLATFVTLLALLFASSEPVSADTGVSTFNDFSSQSGVACAGFSPDNSQGTNIFAAALGDLSPLWTGARCEGTITASDCTGTGSCIDCTGPACPDEEQCGQCFNISCASSLDGETTGSCSDTVIKVKIVDACPSTHPENFCKIAEFGGDVPADQACEASGVNAFDIATTARSLLSSFQGNLNINIESTSC